MLGNNMGTLEKSDNFENGQLVTVLYNNFEDFYAEMY